jgi:uncharacterized membrane protein
MKDFLAHARMYIFRGLFAIIPLALCFFAVQLLYVLIDRRVMKLIGLNIPGLGILLVLVSLYFIGLITSNVIGHRLFAIVESITNRIPLIKTTYQVGKQLASTFSLPEKQVFKRAVLAEYLREGTWTLGFVTGTIIDLKNNNEALLKVFIPTPPNPTSGTMIIVRESQVRDPGCTIEEAIKTVISGGIIGLKEIK